MLVYPDSIGSRPANVFEKFRVELLNEAAAAGWSPRDIFEGRLRPVIVVEIFGGQQFQRGEEVGVEKRRAIDAGKPDGIFPEAMKLGLARVIHLAQPPEMVKTEVIEVALARWESQGVRHILVKFG